MQRFACEVLFLNPADVPRATAALAAVGCTYTVDPDATGDYPTVFGMATGESELDEAELGDWVATIVEQYGGDVVEWRYGAPWKIRE
jgi:hypothetical protein